MIDEEYKIISMNFSLKENDEDEQEDGNLTTQDKIAYKRKKFFLKKIQNAYF